MEAYKQLLAQFHSEQAGTIEQDTHIQYIQLLNQLKSSKQKKLQTKNKIMFESSRMRTFNQDSMKQSTFQKSLKVSRFETVNDTFKQKKSLIELERDSLAQQIDYLNQGFDKLRQQKELVQNEIKMIDKKEIQITNALHESVNNLEEIKSLIKEQTLFNERQFQLYDKKIGQLTQKLQKVNEENVLNSKYYKEMSVTRTQSRNNTLLGTILLWQNEESKIKKLPKKIYTKDQIESMLRALFLLNKLSELNYGNIIQHLIKISEPNEQKRQQFRSQKKIFLNQKGEQIQIRQLIKLLEKQLLTVNESKFLSKSKIIEFYAKKGIVIYSDWETGNLSKETINLIEKVVSHFQKLSSWFSRIQKRNAQLSESFRSLQKRDEQLQSQIKSIESSAAEKSINYLQSRQQQIQHLHERLNDVSKVIFLFNINVYDLTRRFQNLNKFFDKIVKSTNRKTFKKTFVQIEEDSNFLKKITKILFKSPQCIILDWNNVINRVKTESSFVSSGQNFQNNPDNHIYFEKIMKNDLLRIYAQPEMFDPQQSFVQNFKNTFNSVMKEESNIIEKLCKILGQLLLFSKNGIKEYEGYQKQRQEQRKKIALTNDKQTNDKLNPLLKLLQKSDFKIDKFLSKDGVKQDDKPSEQQGFCVQSNDFYRRDNFKLIQKLQKINLKKKGMFPSVPFFVNTSLQLQPGTKTLDNISFDKETTRLGSTRNSYRKRQPRLSHQMLSTRHNIISEKREKQNSRKKDLKMLLNSISNIASQNQKYRIRKKLNSQQQSFSASMSRIHINTSRFA